MKESGSQIYRYHGRVALKSPQLLSPSVILWVQKALSQVSAAERGGDNLKGLEDFHTEDGASQGQSMALTVLFAPKFALHLQCVIPTARPNKFIALAALEIQWIDRRVQGSG